MNENVCLIDAIMYNNYVFSSLLPAQYAVDHYGDAGTDGKPVMHATLDDESVQVKMNYELNNEFIYVELDYN